LAEIETACNHAAKKDLELTPRRRAVPAAAVAVVLALQVQCSFIRIMDMRRWDRAVSLHAQFAFCLKTLASIEAGQPGDPTGKVKPAAGQCVALLGQTIDPWALERWKIDRDTKRLIDESLARHADVDWNDHDAIMSALPVNRNPVSYSRPNDTRVHFATTDSLDRVRTVAAVGLIVMVITAGYSDAGQRTI
jgi:hypothetical protein